MKRRTLNLLTGLCALTIATRAGAISLTLQPTQKTMGVGGHASLDLMISGMGNLASPSLGAFDVDLTFDTSVLAANSVVFGDNLNTAPGFEFFRIDNLLGQLHLDEVSFQTADFLNATQSDSFTLATLRFTGVADGSSAVDIPFARLSDENGNSHDDFLITGGSITVTRVPDAASAGILLMLALLSLSALRRGRELFLTYAGKPKSCTGPGHSNELLTLRFCED